ncbi:unnamed protein product [Effrenium voratum]|uniref:Uncharacterized protein n=1 Tax=Effrenium voratum TaxID=2562239 RepID=A0AA36I9V9_9DINO|nr:unnamed protein product [Effrenium voratum]CAJ1383407.1 unnamed protein product [Effrenium voratum]CAJ1438443.1 unnamed protein product [Effrenium voratum]|mmetsp:Transcript_55824/g.133529  ORF Transcript_55824/g.133529 Transcript_55824/m.133529 type:complete len:221 (+) Transcript_55824:87-749(+)
MLQAALSVLALVLAHAAKTATHHPRAVAGYTQDPVCIKRNCVNPLVPGLEEFGSNVLMEYEQSAWTCQTSQDLTMRSNRSQVGFCEKAISYSFSVPEGADQESIIQRQMQRAVTSYVAHLRGLGRDFWDYQKPWESDDCVQAVWRMACYTHFPRCNEKSQAAYLRPCASACKGYLQACQVNCCDDGAKCSFTHHKKMPDGNVLIEEGYDPHNGPSAHCTG